MLRNLFVVLFVAIFIGSGRGQDLIVTTEGDSINCKITKAEPDYIYFTFKHKGEMRNTLLSVAQVKTYTYNYYSNSEVPSESSVTNFPYPRFRAAINGGWSYRTAKITSNIPSDLKGYVEDLKSGYHYGIDLGYFFTEHVGLGLRYSTFRTKNEIDNVYVTYPNGSSRYGKMSDDISVNFIGPLLNTRLISKNKKNGLFLNFGLGYMGYKDESELVSENFTIKGSTLGLCWEVGYDIGLSDKISIGFQLSLMQGVLSEYEISNGQQTQTIELEKDEYENLSRIDISVGLRFNK
jgi:hypothetical protein